MRKVIHMDSSKMVLSEDSGKTIIITVDNVENMMRSEYSANLSLIPTKRPAWTNPSTCIRTRPTLWQRLLRWFQ